MLITWKKAITGKHLYFSIPVLAVLQVNRSLTDEQKEYDPACNVLSKAGQAAV